MGAIFMKPSGRSSYAGLPPSGRKKVELLIISALLRHATVPHIVALLGSVTGGKDTKIILNFQTFSKRIAFIHCSLRTRCVLLYKTLKSA